MRLCILSYACFSKMTNSCQWVIFNAEGFTGPGQDWFLDAVHTHTKRFACVLCLGCKQLGTETGGREMYRGWWQIRDWAGYNPCLAQCQSNACLLCRFANFKLSWITVRGGILPQSGFFTTRVETHPADWHTFALLLTLAGHRSFLWEGKGSSSAAVINNLFSKERKVKPLGGLVRGVVSLQRSWFGF